MVSIQTDREERERRSEVGDNRLSSILRRGADGNRISRSRPTPHLTNEEAFLATTDAIKPLIISYGVDETPEDLIHWVDENLPRSLKDGALARAFQVLRRADVYLGRTRKETKLRPMEIRCRTDDLGINVVSRQNRDTPCAAKYSPQRIGCASGRRGLNAL